MMNSHFLMDIEPGFVRRAFDEKDVTLREKTHRSEIVTTFGNNETTEETKGICKEESTILRKIRIKRENEGVYYEDSPRCISTENLNDYKENITRKQIRIDPRQARNIREGKDREEKKHQEKSKKNTGKIQQDKSPALLYIDGGFPDAGGIKRKIPRPANSFMLFANEWRKKLASENPRESNKDISVRLGILWKNMAKDAKEKYFALARKVDAEHKRKYPGMLYAYSLGSNRYDLVLAHPVRRPGLLIHATCMACTR